MFKKVAIIGTHSTGKTTLSYMLAAQQKMLGRSVKIIQEVARSCPYPLNEQMTKESCLWIYHEHIKKELEAMQKFDTVICDRSAIDSFMYAIVRNCYDNTDKYMKLCFQSAIEWMNTYSQIIYIKPNEEDPIDDGVRSIDKTFQVDVDIEFFRHTFFMDKNKILMKNADEVFNSEIFDESFASFFSSSISTG